MMPLKCHTTQSIKDRDRYMSFKRVVVDFAKSSFCPSFTGNREPFCAPRHSFKSWMDSHFVTKKMQKYSYFSNSSSLEVGVLFEFSGEGMVITCRVTVENFPFWCAIQALSCLNYLNHSSLSSSPHSKGVFSVLL